jgi:hypothetical protein
VRHLSLCALIVVSLACSTSGSLGQSTNYYTDEQQLWMAVQTVIQDLGGRIIMANKDAQTAVGRFDFEGTPVDLSVDISGSPSPDAGQLSDYRVSAAASLVGDREPDEEWKRQLTWLEDQFFDALEPMVQSSRKQGYVPSDRPLTQP